MDEIYLTSKQMVWLYGVSRETIRKWSDKGMPRAKVNQYPLKACFDWIRENIFSVDESVSLDISQEKLLRERAKRIQDEIKAQQMSGQVVPRDQAIAWVSKLLTEARLAFLGLPRRLAGSLVILQDEREIESVLRHEITKILWQLSRPLPQKSRGKARTASARAAARLETAR